MLVGEHAAVVRLVAEPTLGRPPVTRPVEARAAEHPVVVVGAGPVGLAAYGMPRNTCTPSRSKPSTFPLRVATIVMSAE